MKSKIKRHSLRRIKRMIREGRYPGLKAWKSLSAEQMERAVQYFVISVLRKKLSPKIIPSDVIMSANCGDLLMCSRMQATAFDRDFGNVFGVDFPTELDAGIYQPLHVFIKEAAEYVVKTFGNKRQSV